MKIWKVPQQTINPDPTAPRRWSTILAHLTGYLVGIGLSVGLIVLGFWLAATFRNVSASTAGSVPAASVEQPTATETALPISLERPVVSSDGLAEQSGVRIVQVAVSGEGGLIDLRFQVVDAEKAHVIHDADTPPVIVDTATGLVVDQLLMGHSHTGTFQAGQTYYLIFENPGNLLQHGSTVNVLLGNAEVDNVTIR